MKLLVPGGAGFIGSAFVRAAVARGHEVTVFDALTYRGRLENLEGVEHVFIKGDVGDSESLDAAIGGHEVVVNFANGSFVDRSIKNPFEFVHTNVLGTATLVESVKRAGVRLVHVSTDEVYGSVELPRQSKTTDRLDPSSPYSATKAAADVYCLASVKTYGTPICIARLCNIYGPRQYPENLIPVFTVDLLDGLGVGLYGDGSQSREWMFVDDAAAGLLSVVDAGESGNVYHLGSGVERINKDVAQKIAGLLGVSEDLIGYVADRPGHDVRYRLDLSETKDALGWEALTGFEDGLAKTVDWYRENRAWWEPVRPRS